MLHYSLKGLSIGAIIVLLLGLATIVLEVARTFYLQYPVEDFCSTDDEVYQTIIANLDDWKTTMRRKIDRKDIDSDSLVFSVPSGRSYSIVSYNSNTYSSYLTVVLEHSWNERLGFLGYIYSTLGHTGLEDEDKYRVRYLANDIYCYERKPGYDLTPQTER